MTEKQGNTKQSNLNYMHTVVNMKKKKHVKAKSRTSRKLRKGATFKERKSRTKNRATRENDPRHPYPSLLFLTIPSHSSLAVLSHPCLIKLLASIVVCCLLFVLRSRRCVRRWLIRPVRARTPLPHVEQ